MYFEHQMQESDVKWQESYQCFIQKDVEKKHFHTSPKVVTQNSWCNESIYQACCDWLGALSVRVRMSHCSCTKWWLGHTRSIMQSSGHCATGRMYQFWKKCGRDSPVRCLEWRALVTRRHWLHFCAVQPCDDVSNLLPNIMNM